MRSRTTWPRAQGYLSHRVRYRKSPIYIYIYIYTYMNICNVCIYIYIYRERERERDFGVSIADPARSRPSRPALRSPFLPFRRSTVYGTTLVAFRVAVSFTTPCRFGTAPVLFHLSLPVSPSSPQHRFESCGFVSPQELNHPHIRSRPA